MKRTISLILLALLAFAAAWTTGAGAAPRVHGRTKAVKTIEDVVSGKVEDGRTIGGKTYIVIERLPMTIRLSEATRFTTPNSSPVSITLANAASALKGQTVTILVAQDAASLELNAVEVKVLNTSEKVELQIERAYDAKAPVVMPKDGKP